MLAADVPGSKALYSRWSLVSYGFIPALVGVHVWPPAAMVQFIKLVMLVTYSYDYSGQAGFFSTGKSRFLLSIDAFVQRKVWSPR